MQHAVFERRRERRRGRRHRHRRERRRFVDASVDAPTETTVGPGPLGYYPSNFSSAMLAIADGGVADGAAREIDGGAINWSAALDVVITANCDFSWDPRCERRRRRLRRHCRRTGYR